MERVKLQDHPHLQELELADSAESPDSIDILINSDHYWDFLLQGKLFTESLVPLQ